ncbi:DNA-binding response regulator [Micromonospora sp. CPCC 205711]|uniref:DNA-binding response regulator n=1 Tax=Micromonospora sp. CPCC 205547 TaxID=3122400 RepID=UPI002FF19F3B
MVDVAVVDPLPLFRAGVAAALAAAAHVVEQPPDLLAWARDHPASVLVLTLGSERDWSLLTTVTSRYTAVAVVALTSDAIPAAGVRAVRAGARSILLRSTTPEALRQAVQAAADGVSILPADVLRALGGHEGAVSLNMPRPLSEEQLSWLRALATGSTVTRLASMAGYSERAMYRILRSLYAQLGVHTRTEALIRAQSLGLIDPR